MSIEPVTPRDDGPMSEPGVDRDRRGVVRIVVGVAVLAIVAAAAFFLLSSNRNQAMRTGVVTSAAASVADIAAKADQNVAAVSKEADSAVR